MSNEQLIFYDNLSVFGQNEKSLCSQNIIAFHQIQENRAGRNFVTAWYVCYIENDLNGNENRSELAAGSSFRVFIEGSSYRGSTVN